MEKKVKLYPSDNFKNEYNARLAANCYLLSKQEGKENKGWFSIRLENLFNRFMRIDVRAIEVIENNSPDTWYLNNKQFIKYEVKKNPWYIDYLEYRNGEGFFAIGKKMDLLRTPPLYEMVNV